MIRHIAGTILLALSPVQAQPDRTTTETWTGWFSDKQCARVRPDEAARPNGTACVKKCLAEGSPAVFISEQTRAVYEVSDSDAARNDVGYHLRITADVDEKAKRITVRSIERLADVASICVLPRKR